MKSSAELDEYRASFFRAFADTHNLEIEWNLPSLMPYEPPPSGKRYASRENPEGIIQGPPRGRNGMTKSGFSIG